GIVGSPKHFAVSQEYDPFVVVKRVADDDVLGDKTVDMLRFRTRIQYKRTAVSPVLLESPPCQPPRAKHPAVELYRAIEVCGLDFDAHAAVELPEMKELIVKARAKLDAVGLVAARSVLVFDLDQAWNSFLATLSQFD